MGLLDAIDRVLGTRMGLLVSDPRAAVNALESDARAFNQASLLATQAERNAARGLPVSPEQLAAKQYIDRKNEDLAMGFAAPLNVTKPEIRNIAEELTKKINELGFLAKLEHSGSKAGASSYIRVTDPITGRYLRDPIRISDHSKGPFQSQFVYDISNVSQDFPKIIDTLNQMRSMGKTIVIRQQEYADNLIKQGMSPKNAYKQAQKEIEK
jgi:hypothetical protein